MCTYVEIMPRFTNHNPYELIEHIAEQRLYRSIDR